MSKENENNALDELKRLKRSDRIQTLDIHEPVLNDFDAQAVFKIDEAPQKKKIFGKRSQKARVSINSNLFDEEVADIKDISPATTIEDIEKPMEKKVIYKRSVKKVDDQAILASMPEESIVEAKTEEPEISPVEEKVDIHPVEVDQEVEELDEIDEDIEDDDEYDEDDYDYHEKKNFLYAQYPKIEAYLQKKSLDGSHFVKQEGKKYFFRKGEPKKYYYMMNYYTEEPDPRSWEEDGWKLISRSEGKSKKDAGWFILRNEEQPGEYRKDIDNEAEKFMFFKKYSNSCRSTMFLIFICIMVCAVTLGLQIYFQGYLLLIGSSALLLVIALIWFIVYARMLRHSKKRARMLKARLRLKESQRIVSSRTIYDTSESEEDLDTDWNTLEDRSKPKKKSRRHRNED